MMVHATLGQPIDRRGIHTPRAEVSPATCHTAPPEAGNVHLDLINMDDLVPFENRELMGAMLLLAVFILVGLVAVSLVLGYGWAHLLHWLELGL